MYLGNDKPPLVAAMKKACEPDTVQQLKSLKCKQKAAQKSIQKARKEFHSEFYEEEEEVPPLPPPLPIMQLMSTTTTVPVTTMQDILPTTNTGHHVVPALQAATLPTTTHHVIPSLPAATLPTTRHHVLPALPAATLPTTRHHVIPALPAATLPTTRQHVIPALPAATLPTTRHHVTPSLPAATLPSTSHHVVPAFPAATFPTTSHHFIPALPAATLPTTSHQVEPAATLQPPPLFADLLDDGLLEVLRSVEQSEGGLNDVQPFVSLSREVADIKERLARLEDIISSNSSSIRKTNDGSATVQLILSNTTLGWKLALRKLLLLKFGVNMLGNSCAVGRKDAKFNKLDEAKLLEIKGTHLYIQLFNVMYVLLKLQR